MIDASKSPVPAWKRYATMALLVALVLVAGYVIYVKELHKGSPTSKPAPAPAPASAPARATPAGTPAASQTSATTIPGGIPVSSRNPFQ